MLRTQRVVPQGTRTILPRAGARLLLAVPLLLASCANFRPVQKADIGFFADNTIALLNRFDLYGGREDGVYTRAFLDPEGDEELELLETAGRAQEVLSGISEYTLELVRISEHSRSDEEQVAAYEGYLIGLADRLVYSMGRPEGTFDEELELVRSSGDLLAALRAAQPILSAAGRNALLIADEAERDVRRLALKVDRRIDEEHADVIRFHRTFGQERAAVLEALEDVFLSFGGDGRASARLRERDAVLDRGLRFEGEPTYEELVAVKDHLLARLGDLERVLQVLEPDWQVYREAHRELDVSVAATKDNINRYRMIILVWLRAHERMASGVTNPAKWFDIGAAPSMLLSTGVGLVL